MKNEKVAKGRIIGLVGPCFIISDFPYTYKIKERRDRERETDRPSYRDARTHLKTRPSEANDASFSDFFIFHFLATFSFFYSPRHSLLLVPLFSLSSTV